MTMVMALATSMDQLVIKLSEAMAPIALIILLLLITQLNNHLNGETIPLMETRLHHLKTIPLMVEDISTNKKVVTSTIKLME